MEAIVQRLEFRVVVPAMRVRFPLVSLMFQHAITELKKGKAVEITPRGHSMEPRIQSGQKVRLVPVTVTPPKLNDVVLCKVKGNVYLHKIVGKDQRSERYLIANNKGHTNGWTKTIYGVATGV